ncbi:polyribonucleotide nucleotidyltransferase [Candidatus Parcubacteria bacterium]|nr:polyribonucleotide nucleotidyltransferase [Candidatus Parcubacteria bacterium]
MSHIIKKELDLGGRTLSLETGKLAPQANAAVLASYGETVVLATVVSAEPREDQSFFPLRVDYEERLYAGGFIKSSRFVKREGRPLDEATVTARMIDHAIRPLFPKDFMDEVQVIVTVLSMDQENDPQVLGMIAASAALHASDVPWNGPVGTVRAGLKDDQLVVNPKIAEQESCELDLVVSAVGSRVIGIEGEMKIVDEAKVLEAIKFGVNSIQPILKLIEDFAEEVGKKKYTYEPKVLSKEMVADVEKVAGKELSRMVTTSLEKVDWQDAYDDLEELVYSTCEGKYSKAEMKRALTEVEKQVVRGLILDENKRPDGRKIDEVRPISIELGVLPRTHGSALFQRGLTQALTVATLGSSSLEQLIHSIYGEKTKRFIHHYNGPPFSLGEVQPMRSPGRREIGHGMLAEKALRPVIPAKDEFPYTVRLVSELLSQNGSSSMAATCGSTLALMDAGVKITAPVAGVAIGLVADEAGTKQVVLTDIAGVEDWNGYLDFKMTGTEDGVTAIQMDTKLAKGVAFETLEEVVARSKKARLEILALMKKAIDQPRETLSVHAPKIEVVKINPKKIGDLIGSQGKVIKAICEATGADIDIDEDGTVYVCASDSESVAAARERVEQVTREAKVGEVYDGKVTRVVDFGAFVEIWPGREGLVHVSALSHQYVEDPHQVVKEGQEVKVQVTEIDRMGRVNLSIKALQERPPEADRRPSSSQPDQSGSDQRPRGPHPGYRTPYYRKPGYQRG